MCALLALRPLLNGLTDSPVFKTCHAHLTCGRNGRPISVNIGHDGTDQNFSSVLRLVLPLKGVRFDPKGILSCPKL